MTYEENIYNEALSLGMDTLEALDLAKHGTEADAELATLRAQLAGVTAQRDALLADAERWQYAGRCVDFVLMQDIGDGGADWPNLPEWKAFDTKEEADAAIDAARGKT